MFAKLVIIILTLGIIKSARILTVMPTPSLSHHLVFRPLIQELVDRQHEVTLITTDPVYRQEKPPNNLKEIDVHDVSYLLWYKMFNTWDKNFKPDMLSVMTAIFHILSKVFEEQLKNKSIQNLLRDKTVQFDLLIVEACAIPSLIFSHIFQAPVIQISSFGPYPGIIKMMGGMTHPILYPTHFHERIYNLTIWETISELHQHVKFDWIVKNQEILDNKMLQHIGIKVPLLSDLKKNVHMLFLNIHPIWVHNQPVPSNIIYTWGIHQTPIKILPQDLQYFLDSSTNGVIYISFGTNFKTSLIPQDKLEILLQVFSQSPYNILWKWDTDELPGKSENIKISKWLPQCDVLRHPNLKLFITHGGLQSTDEAINIGVPLIGIPMFADQIYNTEKYEYFKIGIQLHFNTLSAHKLETAIATILRDESYRKNIIHLRTQMQDRPIPPLENAIWWIDYVLRHGGAKHLRSPAANMSWAEYYELELILTVLTGLLVLSITILYIMYSCIKRLTRILNVIMIKTKVLYWIPLQV